MGELISNFELAKRMGVSVETIRRWRNAGRITPAIVTPGNRARWEWPVVIAEDLSPYGGSPQP